MEQIGSAPLTPAAPPPAFLQGLLETKGLSWNVGILIFRKQLIYAVSGMLKCLSSPLHL